jgi:hypothetical protein
MNESAIISLRCIHRNRLWWKLVRSFTRPTRFQQAGWERICIYERLSRLTAQELFG